MIGIEITDYSTWMMMFFIHLNIVIMTCWQK